MKHAVAVALIAIACRSAAPPPLTPQHRRLDRKELLGTRILVDGGLARPVELFLTPAVTARGKCDLLIHFHGAAWIPFQSAGDRPLCVASINLGAGSSVYEKPLLEPGAFEKLLRALEVSTPPVRRLYLSGFSAGYGAIRAILRSHADAVDGVLLLDGLHTGYTADGGLEIEKMEPFRRFAAAAASGSKRLVYTHSEITPDTYASTSETAADLIRFAGAPRVEVNRLRFGMVERFETSCGNLLILGFRGNAAPDHIDHFQAMPEVLPLLFN